MEKTRESGIDLLKVLLMYMVVVLHVLGQGGVLENTEVLSANYEIAWFLEILTMCAVNTFAMASGYVMADSEFKYYRIVVLWLQVVFYTIGISVFFYICVPDSAGVKDIIWSAFPVISQEYWYFTAYFGMFFFIPFINNMVNALSQKDIKCLIFTIFILLSVLTSYKDIFNTEKGYSFLWMAVMYTIGVCCKKIRFKISVKKAVMAYFVLSCIVLVTKFCAETFRGDINNIGSRNSRINDLLVSYTTPMIVLMALSLLIAFSKINLPGKVREVVLFFSKLSFSVYLIHTHPLIFWYLINGAFVNICDLNAVSFLLSILGIAFIIYLICMIIDVLRYELFKIFRVSYIVQSISQKAGSLRIFQKLKV